MKEIQQKLKAAGVKNLKEYGYPEANEENIMTDIIYSGFFRSMLIDNKGYGRTLDEAIDDLLTQIPEL